jgi:urease accessory protein
MIMDMDSTMPRSAHASETASPLPARGERSTSEQERGCRIRGRSDATGLLEGPPHPPSADGAEHPPLANGEDVASPSASTQLDPSALYRLMAWFSPSYPIGAFSYSSGLEWAVGSGDIIDADSLLGWLKVMMTDGAGFYDGVFFVHAWRACDRSDDASLCAILELAAALTPSRERFLETTAQGRAFLEATRAAWPCATLNRLTATGDYALAYPVVAGAAATGHHIPLERALPTYLQALAANWVSAGVRLIPLGQTDGQRVIASLEPIVAVTAERALLAALDDAGSAAFCADLASMRHETQYTRLFRS